MKQCKAIFIFFLFLQNLLVCGQIGVLTNSPDNSAALDIYSSTKGLLIPRIVLSADLSSPAPVNSPAEGLLVFNSGSNQTEGFYYWQNGSWHLIKSPATFDITGPSSSTQNAIVRFDGSSGLQIQNSQVILSDNGNITNVSNLSVDGFTMPNGAAEGKILVSDANGNASWESAPPVDIEKDNAAVVTNANTLNFMGGIGVQDDGAYHTTVTFYTNNVTNDVIQLASGDSLNLNAFGSPAVIPWDIVEEKDAGTFTHSVSLNPSRVEVNTHGIYEFNYMFSHQNKTVKRQTVRARLRINGTTYVPHLASYSFSYQTYDNKVSNVSSSFLVEMNSGDYVELVVNGQTETGISNLVPVENLFFMRLIREL